MTLKEISLELANRPGMLAKVARALAEQQINLAAISVDSTPTKGFVRLIVNDPEKAKAHLEESGFEVELRAMLAIRLEDRAGSFLKVLDILAQEKINVQSVAILVAKEGGQTLVALSTSDIVRARRVLQRAGVISTAAERLVTNADLVAAAPSISSESVGLLL